MSEYDSSFDSYNDEDYESISDNEAESRDDNIHTANVLMTPMLVKTKDVDDYPHKDVELRFERYLYNLQNPDSPICEECGAKLWGKGDLTGQKLECLFCGEIHKPIKERKENETHN